MKTTLWWLRRDLRLHDNQALAAAMCAGDQVIPCFILDPAILKANTFSTRRFAFMLDGLREINAALRARGSYLIVRRGDPKTQLAKLMAQTGAEQIFAERDYSPYARRRDRLVSAELPLTLTSGITVRHPDVVQKKAGGHYTVFSPFKKTWLNLPLPHPQRLISTPSQITTPPNIISQPLPTTPNDAAIFPSGEAEAQRRLKRFTNQRIYCYKTDRDRMDLNGTSSLSPYLRFGMVSARHVTVMALEAIANASDQAEREGAETWLSEVIWREFYHQILFHYPHVRRGSFRPIYDQIQWRNNQTDFHAWTQGKTGYPVVDAAMRQLLQTGWMHNRARMIAASFLTKDLLINWQWGERWFMQQLLDGEHANNNGGWQWVAGTGTDAAPYFRIFNPTSQGKKFDPNGDYIRRWVPELANVPTKCIHEPWKLGTMERELYQSTAYPERIIDHKWAREVTLAAYRSARDPKTNG